MAHITLPEGLAGISGPLRQYPETGQHMTGLAQALLRGQSSLTPGEREIIATYVSSLNECRFCTRSHAAAAECLMGPESAVVGQVIQNVDQAAITPKLRALLAIAAKVQQGGRRVTSEDVAKARAEGADDKAIHDTVLIAAAFCMFNRYVDGLDTAQPDDPPFYGEMGKYLAEHGYGASTRSTT
ncbi:MAG TPA: peroxidase-related enzyme [Capsulimonadaceae bacterium]|nr:peroxidase-related enzyme [Capsulimonadaceae bacterium]